MSASVWTTVVKQALCENFLKDLDHCRENLSHIPPQVVQSFAEALTKEDKGKLQPRLITSLSEEAGKVQKSGSEAQKIALLRSFDRFYVIVPSLARDLCQKKDLQTIVDLATTGLT
jgi:hypothetical protein